MPRPHDVRQPAALRVEPDAVGAARVAEVAAAATKTPPLAAADATAPPSSSSSSSSALPAVLFILLLTLLAGAAAAAALVRRRRLLAPKKQSRNLAEVDLADVYGGILSPYRRGATLEERAALRENGDRDSPRP